MVTVLHRHSAKECVNLETLSKEYGELNNDVGDIDIVCLFN